MKNDQKKILTHWQWLEVSPRIVLNVNYKQRFQTELTAKFTKENFFWRWILLCLHLKNTLKLVRTIGDFFFTHFTFHPGVTEKSHYFLARTRRKALLLIVFIFLLWPYLLFRCCIITVLNNSIYITSSDYSIRATQFTYFLLTT